MDNQIANQILNIRKELPQGIDLVAVSKFHPIEDILQAYNVGQRDFGENRAQELVQKIGKLPSDIRWHFLGHLQKNKLKMVIPHAFLIHSVDTLDLLLAINDYSKRIDKITSCLLEVHIASEESKQGFSSSEILSLMKQLQESPLSHIHLRGLMGMASFTDNQEVVRDEFKTIHSLFDTIRQHYQGSFPDFDKLSIGMSGDYKIAIDEGSNMIRVGTQIFGAREY